MKRYRIEANVKEDEMTDEDIEEFVRDSLTAQGLIVDGVCVYEVNL
jgi:hypothetical protein